MNEKIPTKLKIPIMSWDVNTPSFIREACENCNGGMYPVCWNIFERLLAMVAERAIELDDAVMNVLMLKLNLYGDKEGNPFTTQERRELIKKYTHEIQFL